MAWNEPLAYEITSRPIYEMALGYCMNRTNDWGTSHRLALIEMWCWEREKRDAG